MSILLLFIIIAHFYHCILFLHLFVGIGPKSDIVLEATGNSDVFLNCTSPNLSLKNVCLKAKQGLLSAIVVHHGKIHLNNCLINSNGASIGVLLLGGSIAHIEDSVICNAVVSLI